MATCDRMKLLTVLVLICNLIPVRICVDRGNFKTCDQSSFCKRHRSLQPGESSYELQMNTIQIHSASLEGELMNKKNGILFKFELQTLADNTARMRISEIQPLYPRYEATDALVKDLQYQKLKVQNRDSSGLTVVFGNSKVVITSSPFRVDMYSHDELVISANPRGMLKFEHYRPKQEKKPKEETENEAAQPEPLFEDDDDEPGMWEETFKGHTDTKIKGPSSVGLDFSFVGFANVYGIPQHADKFSLRNTRGMDPFRLYNLDVFEYEVDNNMALYGSVPYMISHSESKTVGLVWLNAAETWVDVESLSEQQNVMITLFEFVKGQSPVAQVDTHWFSETGIIDAFFVLGPTPGDVFKQYARLTGTTQLPPLFSLGYHQSRWNYNDQEDVAGVDSGFDEHDIPYDVLWLDIEHTDGKRYFTWDKSKFPSPTEMINNLTAKGRKLVTIIDPHIKRASGYSVHEDATSKGYYVKNKDGGDYEGWCWPGSSSWLDFLNPEVREYWMSRLALSSYEGSTLSLFVWNDMNEPSVFSGPEVTMHKDAKHFGGWEHRDVHNIYGTLLQKSTYEGLIKRSDGKYRPFVLSRAFFIGTQRYGAIWTGDNAAEWSHLRITIPMLLSISVTGITFCGADVGGFFKSPDAELLVRWYQAGAFQPFFRVHAHIDTRRREPWLFDENTRLLIRDAVRRRYALLPYWYSLFYMSEQDGMPVMRPMWMEFPQDQNTFKIENQYMIGNALLVHPVTESGATKVDVYFPGHDEVWYDADYYDKYDTPGYVSIPVTLSKLPYYQRGGTIIPKKNRIRRASSLGQDDPFSLVVALDKTGQFANGTAYIDDGVSYDYKDGQYIHLSLVYQKGVLKSVLLNPGTNFSTKAWIERIAVLGIQKKPKNIQIDSKSIGKRKLEFVYIDDKQVLIIRKPIVNIGEEWTMMIR